MQGCPVQSMPSLQKGGVSSDVPTTALHEQHTLQLQVLSTLHWHAAGAKEPWLPADRC